MNYKLIRFKNGLYCPHCKGKQIVLWGKRNNIQRYKCQSCLKYFNDLTKTPLAYSKSLNKWPHMMKALQQSLSVRKTANYLGISISTAFRWRHRFLSGLHDSRDNIFLTGIVEIDETMFKYSEKGSHQLNRPPRKRGGPTTKPGRSKEHVYAVIARDRTNLTRSFLLKKMSGKVLIKELGPVIDRKSQVCTDSWQSYQSFTGWLNLRHYQLNIKRGKRVIHGIYHIQNVNSYHSRLKTWIRKFNGVATKYLLNYLTWFEHLDESNKLQYGLGEQFLLSNVISPPKFHFGYRAA